MRAVRLDDRSPQPDLPWADLFQSELDSWTPTRLPAHFRPRPETLTRRTGPLGSWRRAGLGAAVAALVAALLLPAPPRPAAAASWACSACRGGPPGRPGDLQVALRQPVEHARVAGVDALPQAGGQRGRERRRRVVVVPVRIVGREQQAVAPHA